MRTFNVILNGARGGEGTSTVAPPWPSALPAAPGAVTNLIRAGETGERERPANAKARFRERQGGRSRTSRRGFPTVVRGRARPDDMQVRLLVA